MRIGYQSLLFGVFFVAVFGVCPMAALGEDEQRSLDISTEYTASELTIEGPGGPVDLEMRTRLVRLDGSLSRLDHIHLVSLYEPRNGLYWWTYYWVRDPLQPIDALEFGRLTQVRVTEQEIFAVSLLSPPPSLWTRTETWQELSLEHGEKRAMAIVEENFRSLGHLHTSNFVRVSLHDLIPAAFFHAMCDQRFYGAIETISRVEKGWAIVLKGRHDTRADVLLDSTGGLISVDPSADVQTLPIGCGGS